MTYDNLWNVLDIKAKKLEMIKKSYRVGSVPELPYFITGQTNIKNKVQEKLIEIDNVPYFDRVMIVGEYGNGKTNLLKYLQLYFRNNSHLGVKYIIQRANAEKPDIFLQLLKLLEETCMEELIQSIKDKVMDRDDIEEIKEDSPNIKEYIEVLYSDKEEEELKKLIFMGSGRFYTKNYFNKYGINQLSDFDRREVLVLFLNLLFHNKTYIVFAIDEIEKILDKSKIRFKNFLTSYRELIDLSAKINGHLLLTAMSGAQVQAKNLFNENPAFFSRIDKDVVELSPISSKEDIIELIGHIQKLFKTTENENDIYLNITEKIKAAQLEETNRRIIQEICKLILNSENQISVKEKLTEFNLSTKYTNKYQELENTLEFLDTQRTFMYTLESYIKQIGLNSSDLNMRENIYVNSEDKRVNFFFFNEKDLEKRIKLARTYIDNEYKVIVYVPKELELTIKMFTDELKELDNIIEFKEYNLEEMITLIKMYQDPELFEFNDKIYETLQLSFKGTL